MSVWKKWVAALLIAGGFLSSTVQLLGIANAAPICSGRINPRGSGGGGSCT